MVSPKLFGGFALRRLRRREGLTQTALAEAVGLSASYLNLLERNQRPISALVLLRLSDRFDVDPRHFAADEPGGGLDAMMRRLRDPAHNDLGVDRTEVEDWLAAAPGTAAAFARLHDRAAGGPRPGPRPESTAAAAVARWRNYFPDLDARAEALADELRLVSGDAGQAIAERLRSRHRIAVRVLPTDVMPDRLSRLDLHARELQLSEMLDHAARSLAAADQLARLECSAEVDALIEGAELADRPAVGRLRPILFRWAAAAIVLPYGRFLRACESTGYDLLQLQRRFDVGFETLAGRLTTLGRVGARGLPFGLMRFDRAAQLSGRVTGLGGSPLVQAIGLCPLWQAFAAFDRPGEIVRQVVALDDGSRWFTLARTVDAPVARPAGGIARHVVALVLDHRLSDGLGASHSDVLGAAAQPIGPGCATCARTDCAQRALPMVAGEA